MTNNEAAIPSEVAEIDDTEGRLELREDLEATLGTAHERVFALDGHC